jgi:hypothetical protein
MSVLAAFFLVACCAGWGALLLRALGLAFRPAPERAAIAFALGFGMLGWLLYFPAVGGFFSVWLTAALSVMGLPGLWLLREGWPRPERPGPAVAALIAVAALMAALGFVVALGPPLDADSLAYHFALVKALSRDGRLVFEPRAVEAAVPLLNQMTYSAAYVLGGERAMTLWCLFSGTGAAVLVYALARRWLAAGWSLALALAWQSVPAVVFGMVSGQIEPRNAMFVLVAAFALAEAMRTGCRRHAVLAGLAAGFFVAAKYPGLFFAAGAGAVLLLGRHRWRQVPLFGLAVATAGFQWYLWNFLHTGDPLFPSLAALLPYRPETAWDAGMTRLMNEVFSLSDVVVPRSLGWFFWYPWAATLVPHPAFEAGRTGFGPLPLLLVPLALAGAWTMRKCLAGRLGRVALVALAVYALWFFAGPSQRLRHLLPLLPLVMIPMTVAALALPCRGTRLAVAVALAATLVLQVAGLGVFSLKYLRHLASGQPRETMLAELINGWPAVQWINRNLEPTHKVMNGERELNYFFAVPYFYAHYFYQNQVSLADGKGDVRRYWQQLHALGITHLLVGSDGENPLPPRMSDGRAWLTHRLADAGCAEQVARFSVLVRASRTLAGGGTPKDYGIYALTPETCPWR